MLRCFNSVVGYHCPYLHRVVTARKRSLRRLCFYTCLSVILFTGGSESLSRGVSARGVSVRGVSVWGSLSKGGLCPGGSLLGGLCPGGPLLGRLPTVMSGQYTSYWNAFLLMVHLFHFWNQQYFSDKLPLNMIPAQTLFIIEKTYDNDNVFQLFFF